MLLEARKATEQREWHMMKAIQRKLHGTCVSYLVGLAKIIALPDLDTLGLARKADCSKNTARALQSSGMRSFVKDLEARCTTMGVERRPISETSTTQACSHCAFINKNVATHQEWSCPSCGVAHDRDGNAATSVGLRLT